jgi:hypothetical protein
LSVRLVAWFALGLRAQLGGRAAAHYLPRITTSGVHAICYVLRQQAVIERVCDAKIGERRGNPLKMVTTLIACSRKFLTAQIPQSPQSDQARPFIF